MNVSAYNAAFLAAHPDIYRKLRTELCKKLREREVLVIAIKPKYAKAIYEGKKQWEFRKAPPPLFRDMCIYESAPVSMVTGTVCFSMAITGAAFEVYDLVKTNKTYTKNLTVIGYDALKEYAGNKPVTALRVLEANRLDKPIPLDGRPPQNWGKFYTKKKEEGAE